MVKKSIILSALLSLTLCLPAQAVSLEQVQTIMPEVHVYFHGDEASLSTLTLDGITAQLDGAALAPRALSPSSEGIFYVFLLDISKSISSAHLDAAKEAVLHTYKQMGQRDRLAVITFGNSVQVVLSGNEDSAQVESTLNGLRCTDNNTRFYDAMNVLVQTVSEAEVTQSRRVAVVVSDGMEDSDAAMSQADLEAVLRESGVAVYALAVDSAAPAALEQFREFIQVSGGELFPFSPPSADEELDELLSRVDSIWHLFLTADSNIADGQTHGLEIQLGELGTISTQIRPENWIPDEKPPYLLSMDTSTEGAVTLRFSEAMNGLEDADCYRLITPTGSTAPFSIVSADASSVTLAADLPDKAGWKLELSGLSDRSMEQNPMASCILPLSEPNGAADPTDDSGGIKATAQEEILHTVATLAVCLLAGLTVVLLVVFLIRRRGKRTPDSKKPKPQKLEKQTVQFFFHGEDAKKGGGSNDDSGQPQ